MDWRELELSIGDAVRIGNRLITVIDVENEQVAFRIDELPQDLAETELLQNFSPPAK